MYAKLQRTTEMRLSFNLLNVHGVHEETFTLNMTISNKTQIVYEDRSYDSSHLISSELKS